MHYRRATPCPGSAPPASPRPFQSRRRQAWLQRSAARLETPVQTRGSGTGWSKTSRNTSRTVRCSSTSRHSGKQAGKQVGSRLDAPGPVSIITLLIQAAPCADHHAVSCAVPGRCCNGVSTLTNNTTPLHCTALHSTHTLHCTPRRTDHCHIGAGARLAFRLAQHSVRSISTLTHCTSSRYGGAAGGAPGRTGDEYLPGSLPRTDCGADCGLRRRRAARGARQARGGAGRVAVAREHREGLGGLGSRSARARLSGLSPGRPAPGPRPPAPLRSPLQIQVQARPCAVREAVRWGRATIRCSMLQHSSRSSAAPARPPHLAEPRRAEPRDGSEPSRAICLSRSDSGRIPQPPPSWNVVSSHCGCGYDPRPAVPGLTGTSRRPGRPA